MKGKSADLIAYLLEKSYAYRPCPTYVALFYMLYCRGPIVHCFTDESVDIFKVSEKDAAIVDLTAIYPDGKIAHYEVSTAEFPVDFKDGHFYIKVPLTNLSSYNEKAIKLYKSYIS